MQHLNEGVNADADAWASAIAFWDQGPAELKRMRGTYSGTQDHIATA